MDVPVAVFEALFDRAVSILVKTLAYISLLHGQFLIHIRFECLFNLIAFDGLVLVVNPLL